MKSQKGQSLVEFALILPLILFLLFGMFDMGRVLFAAIALEHAAREGARVASVGKSNSEVITSINNATTGLDSNSVSISISSTARIPGENIEIEISYPVNMVNPVWRSFQETFVLSSKSVMRVE
ncbi:TadE-like protein [Bacillus sp. THAF10]|uniref:TadE/TadG family type IV pilus assembly protein n=1 Tax=Bacillus sp. THAF10 TaxID=2587848 RepID=UPI0012687750|nr:TadE family protein [Bacillus sp. THAF10]QFT88466.1 TadE-like protein [Bacillus sp. THAF10]